MKEKIIASIKTKFPTVKLSTKRLEALATTIEAIVGTDETLIETNIDTLNGLYPLAEIAKEDQARASVEGKLKSLQKPPADPPADDPAPPGDDTPAWAKALIEQNKQLAADVAAFKGEKSANTIKAKAGELLKEVPGQFWVGRQLPENEEGLQAFADTVKADYKSLTQQWTEQGLNVLGTPRAGSSGDNNGSKEVSAEVKKFMEAKKAETQPTPAANGMIIKST